MKLTLAKNYILRGWHRLPYAYVNLYTGDITFISEDDFLFLKQCDGKQEIPSIYRDKINHYTNIGVVNEDENGVSDLQLYEKYPVRFIRHAHWAITNKCNFKCKHCFISAPHFDLQDVSYHDCCKIIDELYSCGIFQLSITGGEPLIRKDFIDILKYIKNSNIIVTDLFTNGSFITESFLSEIKDIGINPIFQISYDGKNTHNWMRGLSYAEDIVKKAIKTLKNNGYKVCVSCCLYSDNINYLIENIKDFFLLNVDAIDFGIINQIGEWKNSEQDKIVEIEKVLENIISSIPVIVSMNLPIEINLAGFIKFHSDHSYSIPEVKRDMNKEQLHNWVCCESMRNSLYVSPNGKLMGCEMLTDSFITQEFPNILYNSLREVLVEGNFFMDFIDQRLCVLEENNKECIQCDFYNICHGGCRGNANIAGNYWGVDPIACAFFKKGYYHKVIGIMENLGFK